MDDCPAAISIPVRSAANIHSAVLRINLKLHACVFPAKAPLRRNSLRAEKNKSGLQRDGLRLLPGVPRQTGGVAVNSQLLCPPRAQLVLRQHTENGLTDHPVGF